MEVFVGRFRSADVVLRLKPNGPNLDGTLQFKGNRFPVKATLEPGKIHGEFRDDQSGWPFSATSTAQYRYAGLFDARCSASS